MTSGCPPCYEAIDFQQNAANLIPEDHRDLPKWLNNLGGTLLTLSDTRSRIVDSAYQKDTDKAIEILQRAAALFPKSDPTLPSCLNNLSHAFYLRYQSSGDPIDLENSTEAVQRAIFLTPSGDVQLPDRLLMLGSALEFRAKVEGIVASTHIDDAISAHRRAVSITPEAHARLPVYLKALGASLELKSSAISDEGERASLIEESLACFKRGALAYTGAPSAKLSNAILWAVGSLIPVTAGLPLNFEKSLEAYETVIKLLPLAAGIDQTPERRHHYKPCARQFVPGTPGCYRGIPGRFRGLLDADGRMTGVLEMPGGRFTGSGLGWAGGWMLPERSWL